MPGWTRRLWWRLKRGLGASQGHSGQAPLTAREEVFALQLARLRGQLQDKETEIFRLKTELEFAKAEILVKGKQLELMAEVHELDRARVAADQAVYSAVQAEYEARRQGRGAGQ